MLKTYHTAQSIASYTNSQSCIILLRSYVFHSNSNLNVQNVQQVSNSIRCTHKFDMTQYFYIRCGLNDDVARCPLKHLELEESRKVFSSLVEYL